MSEASLPTAPSEAERRAGFMAAAAAYLMWGFLPLYLKLLTFADVREVLAQRILWCAPAALAARGPRRCSNRPKVGVQN